MLYPERDTDPIAELESGDWHRGSTSKPHHATGHCLGVGPFALPETLLGVSSHLGNQPQGERNPLSLAELVEAGLQHATKRRELMLALVEQSHRFADHSIRNRELAAGNLIPDPGFDGGGKVHCHCTTLGPRNFRLNHPSMSNVSGSSISCLIFTRYRTAVAPSMTRWS